MTSESNDLGKALDQNGSFDPEKAKRAKEKSAGVFDARMRKLERSIWIWLILSVCFGLFGYLRFQSPTTTSTKELIAYAVVMLIAYESTVLLKLAYWIINVKLSVLKEIKLLRLESSPAADPGEILAGRDLEAPLRSISPRERVFWKIGLIAGMLVAITYVIPKVNQPIGPHGRQSDQIHEGYVTLAADGSGITVTESSSMNEGDGPITSFQFDVPTGAANRWVDELGREMPATVKTGDGRSRYVVSFVDPIMPCEWFAYKRITENPTHAVKEGEFWVCRADWSFGRQSYRYTETVKLPEGAEVVSVTPKPDGRTERDGVAPVLRFTADRDPGEHFGYTIRYILPKDAAGENAPQGQE